MFSRDLQ